MSDDLYEQANDTLAEAEETLVSMGLTVQAEVEVPNGDGVATLSWKRGRGDVWALHHGDRPLSEAPLRLRCSALLSLDKIETELLEAVVERNDSVRAAIDAGLEWLRRGRGRQR